MKLNFISIVLLILSLNACTVNSGKSGIKEQDKLFKEYLNQINFSIKTMSDSDQYFRHLADYGTGDELVIDSLYKVYAGRGWDLDSMIASRPDMFTDIHYRDSIEMLEVANDKRNTIKLLYIINQYGYPSERRISNGTAVAPNILIHHTPEQYLDTMKKLLQREFELQRIDTLDYKMLGWHLSGRPIYYDFPEGVEVIFADTDSSRL